MVINVTNFGDILLSRPAGREAFLMAKAYVFKEIKNNDDIILDFDKIKVLTPSWADEFITGIKAEYTNTVQYLNTENPSVKASLKAIEG
ncbi:MAG: STAS-like domain-containing protein [Treponema sp.]|nr:STAS-like domain-containing protein [Treponema sp.]